MTFVNYAGTALSGISVTMNNQTVTTNASGQAIFSNVIDGTYNWSSTAKSPYQAKSGSVTVNGANVNQQITLTSQVTVTFVAKDDAGTALSGATVKVAGVSKGTTNSSGQLAVTMQSQSAAYACTVELSGYQTWSGNVTVGLSAQTVNASLQYLVTFTATIKENTTSGANVGSATVKLVNSSLGTFTGTTNSSGVATIPNVKPGSYTYTISKSGYKDTTGSVTVSRSSHSQSATYALLRYYTFVVNVKRAGVNRNGVTVKLDGTSKGTTNSSGNITISNVLYGSHTIAIDAGTYWKAFSQSYTISSTSTINIALTALYTAQFTISDANGPISGATITLTGIATGTLTTNSLGAASKTGIAAGTLSYSVSAAGYTTKTGTVTLSGSNDSINTSITLTKATKLVQITTPLGVSDCTVEPGYTYLNFLVIGGGGGGGGASIQNNYGGGGGGGGGMWCGKNKLSNSFDSPFQIVIGGGGGGGNGAYGGYNGELGSVTRIRATSGEIYEGYGGYGGYGTISSSGNSRADGGNGGSCGFSGSQTVLAFGAGGGGGGGGGNGSAGGGAGGGGARNLNATSTSTSSRGSSGNSAVGGNGGISDGGDGSSSKYHSGGNGGNGSGNTSTTTPGTGGSGGSGYEGTVPSVFQFPDGGGGRGGNGIYHTGYNEYPGGGGGGGSFGKGGAGGTGGNGTIGEYGAGGGGGGVGENIGGNGASGGQGLIILYYTNDVI